MKRALKDVRDLSRAGVITGVGAGVVSKAGGNASGMSAFASGFGTVGMIQGAGMSMRQMKRLSPTSKRKRRY